MLKILSPWLKLLDNIIQLVIKIIKGFIIHHPNFFKSGGQHLKFWILNHFGTFMSGFKNIPSFHSGLPHRDTFKFLWWNCHKYGVKTFIVPIALIDLIFRPSAQIFRCHTTIDITGGYWPTLTQKPQTRSSRDFKNNLINLYFQVCLIVSIKISWDRQWLIAIHLDKGSWTKNRLWYQLKNMV